MQAVVFYLVYPILYLIASLPFWALYKLSDGLYYLFYLSGYRKDVVLMNLRNSFPEKNEDEIQKLCKAYFRYLCDLTLETLKTIRMTEKEARERCEFVRAGWLEQMYGSGQSLVFVTGHYGNWEWAGPSFSLNNKVQLVVIYRPLSNPYFENMLVKARTKFGTRITPDTQTLRDMIANKNKVTVTTFIADQAATGSNSYWTTFLHQDTPVANGPEKIARKFNYPVVFIKISRKRRGYYRLEPELLIEKPTATADGEILEAFTKRLEQCIKEDPVIWLWSHKRWKLKRTPQPVVQ